jgi:regulator of sigma E protease
MVIAVTVLAIALLIVVHEFGHFLAARACGMRVERFSVGFGPVLARRTAGETEWALSAIPLGGYVKIAGMAAEEAIDPADRAAYCNQPAWRRFLVILAGPGMNYAAAVALATGLFLSVGFHEPDPRPVLGPVIPEGAAAQAGLRAGDRILAVDGRPVSTWAELVAEVVARPGRPARLEVERGGEALAVVVTPRDEGGVGRIGVMPSSRAVQAPSAWAAAARAFSATNQRAADVLSGFWQMVTGRQKAQVQGPLGIAQEMARSARQGPGPFLAAVWFISLVLAIFNLLPVPALDGGRLLVLAWEIVTRRRVNPRVENAVPFVGFVALLALLVWVTLFGDLARLLRR